ncbi:MAG: glyoxylase-like metal-dependent hydrolase (beta-lactamase superfamily II) [Candidatus Aldehydirespiratoraceae bacterium]|jgi:glyoxylase-like metal-dependent hydrolase (beta-lactamase superfamily II)
MSGLVRRIVRNVIADWGTDERALTDTVSVLCGANKGGYPSGNSLVVRGASETIIIDPSIDVVSRGGAPVPVDAVVNSHCHEDHMAGNGFFADAKIHVNTQDLPGVTSLDGLMEVYGLDGEARRDFETTVLNEFNYTPRPDANGFTDGHVFDLGGGTSVEAVHLPGHTRGHSGFRMDGVFFLSDIDLTGFGPYYGDVWSDLDDFEESLVKVRNEEADFYVTYHHKGIIEGREEFVRLLDGFHAVIGRRHDAMLEFLAEPHSIEEMAAHRFIYRPHVQMAFVDSVEQRSSQMHVARMLRQGAAAEVEPGRFQVI